MPFIQTRHVIFLVLFLLTLSISASAETEKHGNIDTTEIDHRIQSLMSLPEMTGLAVSIVEDGKITFTRGYGETIRGSGHIVNENTVFRWASISKGVASYLLASMEENGELSLNQTASSLAPSLNLPESEMRVSIKDLLAHKSGLLPNSYDNRIEDNQGAKETREGLNELPLICLPTTCHTYQNVAYDAASEIIETIKQLPYKSVVKTEVFDKLDMISATTSHLGLHQSNDWARPHDRFGQVISTVEPSYYRLPAAAGINSSVKDLARWMIAQMPDNTVKQTLWETLSNPISDQPRLHPNIDNIQKKLQTPLVQTPHEQRFLTRRFRQLQDAQYGLGFRIYNYAGHKVVGHRGGVDGYRALILFDPEERSGIAVMWNTPHSRPIGLQLEFMDQLYGLPKRDWLRLNERM